MKKSIFFTLFITLLAINWSLALGDKDVPAAVTSTFNSKYPGMKVSDWDYKSDQNAYVAQFNMSGRKKYAWFSTDGTWIGTNSELKVEDLPPAVFKSLTSGEYKDWTFGDYRETDSPEGLRIKVKAKYGNKEHHLTYNEAGMLLNKVDAKASGKTLPY